MTQALKMALASAVLGSAIVAGQTGSARAENTIRLCTGGEGGNYDYSGKTLKKTISGTALELINTEGSWDNLQKVKAGECDAAVVQEDAVIAFQRSTNMDLIPLADLYPESLHLVCHPQSGVSELYDLAGTQKSIALGKAGSGQWVTWKNLKDADERFSSVVLRTESGKLAASLVKQGLVDCFLSVSGTASATLNSIDDHYGYPDTVLVEVDSKKLLQHKSMSGNALYTRNTIKEGTYPKWTGNNKWGSDDVDTVAVNAKIVVNGEHVGEDDQINFLGAIERGLPAIHHHVGLMR